MNLIIYLIAFFAGAAAGSFLGVIIYRLPRSLDFPGSFPCCTTCGHRLHAGDLVPVISYFALKKRCRFCGGAIPSRYLAIEAISGILAALSWMAFPPPAAFLNFAVLACLLAVAFIDHDTMEIPDQLSIAIAVCGVLAIFVGPDIGLKSHLIGIAVAAVPLFIIAIFVEGAFGFGDVKLMAAAGLFLGWQNCLVALFIGIIIGGVYGACLLLAKKKTGKEHFAFGPALCAGIGLAMFAGGAISDWYFLVL
ncbi:MAG: prepilin peptidase [Clostridiales bacterium]|nr:prepilin peptidase [Clostridiales bacterium]